MTPIGASILFLCFVGPILPPVIGTIVGSIYDAMKRPADSADVLTRRRLADRRASANATRNVPLSEAA